MIIKKILMALAVCSLSLTAQAGTIGPYVEQKVWSVYGGIGYEWYYFGYDGGSSLSDPAAQASIGDGQTGFGRFAIARSVYITNNMSFGVELGLQSGNIMRLSIPQVTLDLLGGMPVQANIKPMIDLLATATTEPLFKTPVVGVAKAGIAYRRMQINDRVTVNDLSQIGFEVQAGMGTAITERSKIALLYQGVFNGSTNFTVNTALNVGHISNIPMQNGLLLALSYTL